jgi:hypothetical protein
VKSSSINKTKLLNNKVYEGIDNEVNANTRLIMDQDITRELRNSIKQNNQPKPLIDEEMLGEINTFNKPILSKPKVEVNAKD